MPVGDHFCNEWAILKHDTHTHITSPEQAMFGYAFVNFVDELKALRARRIFEGLVSESAVRMAVVHCHLWFAALQKSRKIPSGKHPKNYGNSPFFNR